MRGKDDQQLDVFGYVSPEQRVTQASLASGRPSMLFRWFVGLNMDDAVWDVTVFTKNRERLLDGDIAEAFFQAVLEQAAAC